MISPLVSICIPTYNRPDYFKKALKSCFNQTFQDFEIVVYDSSTNDKTYKLVKKINHKQICYFKNKEKIRGTLNVYKFARGKYIKYLLDDDLLKPDCLEKMVKAIEDNPSVGVVMAPLDIIDAYGRRAYPRFYIVKKMSYLYKYLDRDALVKKEVILKDFLTRVYPCCVPTGIMYRKECFDKLGGFDQKADFAVDVEICMRFATKYDFYYINKVLSSWRYTKSSHTVSLHAGGFNPKIFYSISRKYLNNNKLMASFFGKDKEKVQKDAYLFASKRLFLNIATGIKTNNVKLIFRTIKDISKLDRYFINKLKLPIIIIRDLIKAFFDI